jgi:hypothetical protein
LLFLMGFLVVCGIIIDTSIQFKINVRFSCDEVRNRRGD